QVPDRYAAADPMAHPRPDAPTVLVHGTDDDRVPVDLSRGYAAQTGARLVELPGVEHFGVIDPESAAWPAVLGALSEIDQVLTSDLSNR
ncbi:MAG: alpha/beta hydrolase, partial [Dactylosporangium sp.]|nr:alpha/beta hydrolase [Dactylosporangium sp.]